MSEFNIPRRAIQDATAELRPDGADAAPATAFKVPGRVVRDLGELTGNVSRADELLDQPVEETSIPVAPQQPTADDWLTRRNRFLANRNMSFIHGKTHEAYDQLSERRRKRAQALGEKLIALYSDRGVSNQSVGLVNGNPVIGEMLQRGGGGVWDADDFDECWVLHLGVPLDDRQLPDGTYESDQTYVRHRGLKRPVVNFHDTNLMRIPWGMQQGILPRLQDNEWLPAIQVI